MAPRLRGEEASARGPAARACAHALDDARRGGRDLAEGVDVRHDVMASLLFLRHGDIELLRVEVLLRASKFNPRMPPGSGATHQVGLHLLDGLVRYREAELLLRDGKVEPKLPPRVETVLHKSERKQG